MSQARLSLGLPLLGVDREARRAVPFAEAVDRWYARNISGLRFEGSDRLTPWPQISFYLNTANNFRVTRLFNIRWGDGTSDIVRHSRGDNATGFNGFHEASGGAWVSRSAAINLGTSDEIWGSAVCPGNTGKGWYVFTKRVATGGPWRWGGAAADAVALASVDPGRFVVNFADRAFVFNQLSGGVVQSRRSQWSRPGDATSWTGSGASTRTLNEIDGDINGAAPLRGALIVYGPNTILFGSEQYILNAPVRYDIFSRGIGVWSPPSLIAEEDRHYFLSQQGFRSFDGSSVEALGPRGSERSPIDAYVLENINRSALDNVVALSFKPWRTLIWGLPMSGSTNANEFWLYNTVLRAWTNLNSAISYFSSSPSSLSIVDQTSAPQWDDAGLAGMLWDGTGAADGINRAGDTWLDGAGAGIRPQIIVGHANGVTRILDETQIKTNLRITLETPPFTLAGIPLFSGKDVPPAERILDEDVKVLDRVAMRWRTISGSSTIHVYVSEDGGATFSYFGPISMSDSVSSALRYNFATGRFSGPTIMLRFTNVDPNGVVNSFGQQIEDFSIGVKRAGEVRGAT